MSYGEARTVRTIGMGAFRRRRQTRWLLYAAAIIGGLWFSVTTLRTPDAAVALQGTGPPLPKGMVLWVLPWQVDRLPRPASGAWFGVADGLLAVGAIWPLLRLAR